MPTKGISSLMLEQNINATSLYLRVLINSPQCLNKTKQL